MKILAIAAVTLREVWNRKVQVNLLLFGLLLVLSSYVAAALTVGEQHRIIADMGLSGMTLVGTLLAAFLGASLIAGDLERRVLYPVVAKPVSRSDYLLGRYLGLSAALVMNILAMAVLLAGLLAFEAWSFKPLDAVLGAAVFMMCVQILVVAAIAIFFSAFTTTSLAAIFTLSIAIAAHLTNDMRALWRGGSDLLPRIIWYALPNFSALTLNEAVIYRTPVTGSLLLPAVYALCYMGAVLALGAAVFERRDFR